MPKLKVAVLFGGKSGEHEVSLISARSVINALNKKKYEIFPIGITKQGQWIARPDVLKLLESKSAQIKKLPPALLSSPDKKELVIVKARQSGVMKYTPQKIDVILPILHGPYGEDGTLQGMLEMADIPYVGSGVLGSALAMDKIVMKMIFAQNSLPICQYHWFNRRDWQINQNQIIRRIERNLQYPCFVKPANLGSSVGITKAHQRKELKQGIEEACQYDRRIIVEDGVNCREIECSVLGNEEPIVSVPGEIIPNREFYDYQAKYIDDKSQLIIPAKLTQKQKRQIQEMAKKAFVSLDLAGMARADFFIRKEDSRIFIDEVNTIPGFTQISMYPKLWQASGMKYSELLDRLIRLALERYQEKKKNKVEFALKK
ncbi:MAG: D-alanine--D-alanine ligase [Candidatus Portnoybacteria bacterium]|nr:D-alanine--D-alanine ligase [Candidatus Portnoybacteria bacterium]